ncbi:restriction endonuclease subunit S [Vibrio antiquarius]|uniref:restriction endonuclease subunit S n=1 Tax=Vibrio antiquarius (strain Ex25) TaxID=150340 RepID=UPI0026593212|nr:restriction endonuclease subunit S [Vibrio antiquarius]MCR9849656.1 restriction endonuclease subunit S [Vibrio antiquarius]MCR9915748.1 restriction endonuclease subunit S [Vibrio antiquarius]
MSVDTLRETFHINRISTSDLQDFLTAQTYRPEITQAKSHILSLKNCSLQSVCTKLIQQGKSPKYAETGLKCIKPKNTNDMLVSIEEIDWIDLDTKEQIQKQKLEYGDIVITRSGSGTIGRASVYCYEEEAYTNDHLFVVRPDKADSHYICAFLKSFHGQRLLEAGISGSTGQLNLSNEHIKSIPLFRPDDEAQKYIGDKVRQAEQLRAWAKQVVSNLHREFEGFYRPITHYDSFRRMSYPIRPDQLFEVLTPASYPPHIEKYFEENPNVTLGEICSDIYIGKTLASIESSDGVKQATSRSCSGLFLKQPMNLVERKGNVEPLAKKDILLTNAAHDKNYIGKDVSFNHSDELILPSAKVLVVRLKECGIPASYVHAYLMTEAGYTQWQAIVRGISAGIHPSDVARIRIPVPENRALLETMAMKADDLYIQAGLAQEVSRLLTIAAKNLVEALIEGKLTEQQLIQAQQTLDDGDNSLDQAILSKLSNEGYAIDGATPLFSDMDELYRLMESAAQAEAEE